MDKSDSAASNSVMKSSKNSMMKSGNSLTRGQGQGSMQFDIEEPEPKKS